VSSLFGSDAPLVVAPMAGGATTPALVIAAGRAGAFGLLAGGYRTPSALADEITAVRAAGVPFGVNLFAPNPLPVAAETFRRYAAELQPEADAYGLELAGTGPIDDDDAWHEKVALLLESPAPVISFTFGIPDPATIAAFRKAGTLVLQTVTSAAEAAAARDAGVDALIVQAAAAGGHSATLTPERPLEELPLDELLGRIGAASSLPLIAAGGISTADDVAAALGAGAAYAMAGTAFLLADEAGTSATHAAAIADPSSPDTVLTRAFTGRPARGIRNGFIDRHEAHAPLGYPAIHHLTRGLRRAAAAAGDRERVHLWAGTGYRHAVGAPAATIVARLLASP
jgi:nitronate monooxygenase